MSEERPLLEMLAVACQKHKATHHKNQNGAAHFEDEMPQGCKRDLEFLKELIPKVEASYCKDVRSTDVANLCDFYNDVLEGGFCPHAPNLFRWGDSETGK
jgi:hypothetical protein